MHNYYKHLQRVLLEFKCICQNRHVTYRPPHHNCYICDGIGFNRSQTKFLKRLIYVHKQSHIKELM